MFEMIVLQNPKTHINFLSSRDLGKLWGNIFLNTKNRRDVSNGSTERGSICRMNPHARERHRFTPIKDTKSSSRQMFIITGGPSLPMTTIPHYNSMVQIYLRSDLIGCIMMQFGF